MMRSMFAGVSGLRSHQTMMDVVGHNIANVNTPGSTILIIAQRGFHANSRIITASDELLGDLVNLKR